MKSIMIIYVQMIIFGENSGKMEKLSFFIAAILVISFSGCSHQKEENVIKVITLNVRYDNPEDSVNAWPKRASQVCNFIVSEKPDILGMQEVLWNQYKLMDSVLTDYSSVGVGREDGSRRGEMNPVFFRKDKFDEVRCITFWLSDFPDLPGSIGWGSSLPRIVTWMEFVEKKSHKHFFFFNTHFAHDSETARLMSSRVLLKEVNRISEGFPFIISGDFNMPPTSTGYSILTGPDESVPLIKDAYVITEKRPSGPVYTFNGFSDRTKAERVDYIFVRNGMKVTEYKTVTKKDKGIFISDHWPVVALVSLE
jgi:endonuclease/exonuclease/phosphatase family metal-dependent hydrolase